ncbi:MAG TPA: T9SS type A sorting domain-containing protein [Mariniphaga anaerophila]|uniref:T9SS type A sorting domain-containing protein n=1 Tax=Mariniphaga anaerophila TaxID=1484053 RepID=A0A831LYY0_9BACT|nr:T9SS type A sorting domain-containing protein [Mariniphaga anaerophila]
MDFEIKEAYYLHITQRCCKFCAMKKLILISIFSIFIFIVFPAEANVFVQNQERSGFNEPDRFELNIYPNPTETGRITLEMNNEEIQEIRLINITGKEVLLRKMEFGTPKYLLSLENIPNGIYFVRVKTTGNKTVVKKLVVASR